MARIRTIKPEFWEDELIASLSRDARLLFIATWNLADDEGRMRWSPAYIKAKVFPYDIDLGLDDVARLMAELEDSGRVLPYEVTETITQTFAVVVNFARHQRINRAQDSSLPPPPPDKPNPPRGEDPFIDRSVNGHGATNDLTLGDQPHLSDRPALEGKGKEGKGKEGKGKEGSASALALLAAPDPFPAFWAVYPRKVDKRTAEKAYRAAVKRGASPAHIQAGVEAYAAATRGTEQRFIKHPSTWLNADAFDNAPTELRLVSGDAPRRGWVDRPASDYEGTL